jgi:L-rhamnose-H+ transport protein
MEIIFGLSFILIAGIFQGTFVLPMTLTKKWEWENTWMTFSVFGMVLLNWLLSWLFIPNLLSVYSAVPVNDLMILIIFGLGWGIGAVLFGIAMDKLGMALGYPIIMGLIASLGALAPMIIFHAPEIVTMKGILLLLATVVVIIGIIICTRAHSLKQKMQNNKTRNSSAIILIAIAAGVLSCFPNVGVAFGSSVITEALKAGASGFMAGNAVWALFFTMGFIPNGIYTIYLMKKNKSFHRFTQAGLKNYILGFEMAIMWIGSFYFYGVGAAKIGGWGLIIGWPLFISISIVIGNLWGIRNGEWKGAPEAARKKLNLGLVVIFIAMIVLGFCNIF